MSLQSQSLVLRNLVKKAIADERARSRLQQRRQFQAVPDVPPPLALGSFFKYPNDAAGRAARQSNASADDAPVDDSTVVRGEPGAFRKKKPPLILRTRTFLWSISIHVSVQVKVVERDVGGWGAKRCWCRCCSAARALMVTSKHVRSECVANVVRKPPPPDVARAAVVPLLPNPRPTTHVVWQLIVANVFFSLITCAIYVADTYEHNANIVRGNDTSALLSAYVNADFAIAMLFLAYFVARRYRVGGSRVFTARYARQRWWSVW